MSTHKNTLLIVLLVLLVGWFGYSVSMMYIAHPAEVSVLQAKIEKLDGHLESFHNTATHYRKAWERCVSQSD